MAAKPVSMFDPTLIELQKQYAKNLLTHYNPYTKLRYCDDPTIALIEITNENSILASWHNNELNGKFFGLKEHSIPDYYVRQLDSLWNVWLQNKYGNLENLKTAWSNQQQPSSITNQTLATDKGPWTIEQHAEATGFFSPTPEGFILEATSISPTSWHLQFRTSPVSLIKNQTYTLKFSAKAKTATPISLVCQQDASPWANLGLSESIELTEQWQNFELPFVANETCSNTKLAFLFGHTQNKIWIKNINLSTSDNPDSKEIKKATGFTFQRPLYKLRSFYSPQKLQDCQDFYIELEKLYFKQILKTLREEIVTKIPITGIGGFWASEDMEAMQECDFLDKHAYWDHPRFPNKPWDKNDFRIHNKSILNDPNLGIIGPLVIASREAAKQSKPFTVTEWNHCYPNQYAYETPLLLSATAHQNDWDALFQFAFSHGWETNPELDNIQSFFDAMPNAQQLILCSLSSYIFLKNDPIDYSITNGIFYFKSDTISGACGQIKDAKLILGNFSVIPTTNGSIILLNPQTPESDKKNSNTFFMISKIKNKDSSWKNGFFFWGTNPTLLNKIKTKNNLQQKMKSYPATVQNN